MKHGLGSWVLVALLLGGSGVAGAQVYTWTDEQGRKHFTDEAATPGNGRTKRVEVTPPNLANRFVPSSSTTTTTLPAEGSPTKPDVTVAVAPNTGFQSKNARKKNFTREECASLKQAYDASSECFAACSTPANANGYGQKGRNNANCGHCQQMIMPRC